MHFFSFLFFLLCCTVLCFAVHSFVRHSIRKSVTMQPCISKWLINVNRMRSMRSANACSFTADCKYPICLFETIEMNYIFGVYSPNIYRFCWIFLPTFRDPFVSIFLAFSNRDELFFKSRLNPNWLKSMPSSHCVVSKWLPIDRPSIAHRSPADVDRTISAVVLLKTVNEVAE